MKFEYYIGRRNLQSGQNSSFVSVTTTGLSTLGVALGVMVLIIVIAVMTGFEEDLKKRILGIEPHVLVMRYNDTLTDYDALVGKIRQVDGVKSAAPFIYGQTMLRSAKGLSGVVLRGIDPQVMGCGLKTTEKTCFSQVLAGSETPDSAPFLPGVVIGKALAEELNVSRGDVIELVASRISDGGSSHVPTIKRVKILGFFEIGMLDYDGHMAFIHFRDAQTLLHMEGRATGISVRLGDVYQADDIAQQIISFLDFPYWARDWMQMNRNLFSMLRLQKTVMYIILTLIVLVAASNIASALIMMVMERTKEIAILKTMGAANKSIRRIFVFKGMIIGGIGTFFGACFGFFACFLLRHYRFIDLPGDVYYLTTLPVQITALDVGIIISATLLICFLSTLYPARYASKFNPVEGIRYG